MAKKKAPVTVAGIRAQVAGKIAEKKAQKTASSGPVASAAESTTKRTKPAEPDYRNAYSFISRTLKKHSLTTEVCEFLWHVPKDVHKFGAVGSARKYLSGLFMFLSQAVAKP